MTIFHPTVIRLITLILLANSHLLADDLSVPADDHRIIWMGRVDSSSSRIRMGFPGIAFRYAYKGEAPQIRMFASTEDCYFNVRWNNSEPVILRLEKGLNELTLPFPGSHRNPATVEFYRRNESWMGTVEFLGMTLDADSQLVIPEAFPDRKLMFIGDSTTCGEFNERFPPNEVISAATTNVEKSYGALISKSLNAQYHLVAYGGQGITRDWSGKAEGEHVVLAPDYFVRSFPSDSTSTWDHSEYIPDLIVVNIGTDFDAGNPDEKSFYHVYYNFIQMIRTAYPNAHILLTDSNFLSDKPGTNHYDSRQQLSRTLKYVVTRFSDEGDGEVSYTSSSYYPGTAKDTHLTVFQHESLALELISPIKTILGW